MPELLTCGHLLRAWVYEDQTLSLKHYHSYCPQCREHAAYTITTENDK